MMEVTCYGEFDPDIDPVSASRWMQGKPVRQCISKEQNRVIGTITLAEPIGGQKVKVTVVFTDEEACESMKDYDSFAIRDCKVKE